MFEYVEHQRDRFLVGDQIGMIDLDVLDDRRDAGEADPLGDRTAFGHGRLAVLEQVVHRGAARIGDADRDVLLLLAQIGRNAGQRTAGADRADEAVDLALRYRARFPARSTRNAPCGCRGCSIDRRTARRSFRSCAIRRRACGRHADNCSDWRRAGPELRRVRRRTAAACPSFPGFAFPGSRSACDSRAHWRPAPARSRYCRRCFRPPARRASVRRASRLPESSGGRRDPSPTDRDS